MPQIPSYDRSQAKLGISTPDPRSAGQMGEMISKAGAGLNDLGDRFKKVQDDTDIIKAKTQAIRLMGQANIEAATDPDLATASERYDRRLREIVQQTSENIYSADAKNQYKNSMDLHLETRGLAIQNLIHKRQIDEAQGAGMAHIDELTNQYHAAADQGHRDAIEGEIRKTVQTFVNNGSMHAEAAQNYLDKHLYAMREGQAEYDINMYKEAPDGKTLLENVVKEVDKGPDGIYKLTVEQENKILPKAERAFKYAEAKQKEEIRRINHVTDKDLTWKYINGALTKDDIRQNFNKLTPARAATLTGLLEKGSIPQAKHPKEYADMMEYLDPKNGHTERECIEKLLDMEKGGKLSHKEVKQVAQTFYVPMDKDPVVQLQQRHGLDDMLEAQEKKDELSKEKRGWFAAHWQTLLNHFGKDKGAAEDASDASQKAQEINQKSGNDNLLQATRQVISDDIAKKFPDIATYPKEGKVKFDGKSYYLFFPDKTYQQIGEAEAMKHLKVESK